MPLRLADLDADALALVLLCLPAEARRRDWVFVALTCRALRAAVLLAFRASEDERLRTVDRLPLGPAPKPSGKRYATSVEGIWTSPRRILFAKAHLFDASGEVKAFFARAFVPPRVRDAFAAAQTYDPRQTHEHRMEVESRAAYHLSSAALYLLLAHAPLCTIRASFFEVLGGGRSPKHFALDLSLRHHRCLVTFASAHGRVDVLEWLVHRCPESAHAYDYDNGLLQLFLNSYQQREAVDELSCLVLAPAAANGRVEVLQWLEATVGALGTRQGTGEWNLRTSFRAISGPQVRLVLSLAGLELGRSVPGSRQQMSAQQWTAFRTLLMEAAWHGQARTLDHVWTSVRSLTEGTAGGAPRPPIELRRFQAGMTFAVLLTVLRSARLEGGTLRWLVSVCTRERERLIELAEESHGANSILEWKDRWHPDTFDFEDLMAAAVWLPNPNASHRACFQNMGILDTAGGIATPQSTRRTVDQQHRWLCCVGDALQVDWLLDEVDHALAQGHLSRPPPSSPNGGLLRWTPNAPPCGVAGFDRATNRGWFARSLAFSSEEDFAPTFNIAARRVASQRSDASVVEAVHEAMLDLACKAVNAVDTQLPSNEHDLYRVAHRRPHRACGPWLAEEGWIGQTHAGDAVAAVLRRHYALTADFGALPSARMDQAVRACRFALLSAPEPCYGVMQEVVDAGRGGAQFVRLLLETTSEAMSKRVGNLDNWHDDELPDFPNSTTRSRGALVVLERAYRDLAQRAARAHGQPPVSEE